MDPYTKLFRALHDSEVEFLVIGVEGANYFLSTGQATFATEDLDLFLPPNAANTLAACECCRDLGYRLSSAGEPLDPQLDLWLAERIVEHRASIRAADPDSGAQLDLTHTMAGFEFVTLWPARRRFSVGDTEVPVAPLRAIVESKRRAGRKKDLLFLVTHDEVLKEVLGECEESEG